MLILKLKFEMWVLIIIVLFGVVFLLGIFCIFRYKFFLWRLSKNDFEFIIVEFKIDVVNVNKVNLYQVFFNFELGISGIELELDFVLIVQFNKVGCKFLCV